MLLSIQMPWDFYPLMYVDIYTFNNNDGHIIALPPDKFISLKIRHFSDEGEEFMPTIIHASDLTKSDWKVISRIARLFVTNDSVHLLNKRTGEICILSSGQHITIIGAADFDTLLQEKGA